VELATDRFSGKSFYRVTDNAMPKIDEWWRQRFFLYDNKIASASDENSILNVFEYAVRRYGCSVFLVDNLMTARFSTSAERDFFRAQSNFTGRLVEFAKKFEVHVHLVAHRRKGGNEKKRGDSDDVSGSSEITNRADNLFGVSRIEEEGSEFNARLEIILNRSYGETGCIDMKFDPRSRRFYLQNPNWSCGWERKSKVLQGQQQFTVITGKSDDNPFL
jgi:twinkle protein